MEVMTTISRGWFLIMFLKKIIQGVSVLIKKTGFYYLLTGLFDNYDETYAGVSFDVTRFVIIFPERHRISVYH